jgi:hypothetical protein
MEYREAGTGGVAKSTIVAQHSALLHFVAYLKTKNLVYETMTEDEICQESLLRQFGTYLITTARTKKGKKMFRRDSAYGSVIQTLKRKFKKNELLSNPTFVTEVRSDILKLIARRNILEGEEISEKSKGVGRNVMMLIGKIEYPRK